MSLRSEISGEFDRAALDRLTWPVAWNGTVPQSDRDEQEADRSALVAEAREALDEAIPADGYAVEIKGGEIVGVLCVTSDDE